MSGRQEMEGIPDEKERESCKFILLIDRFDCTVQSYTYIGDIIILGRSISSPPQVTTNLSPQALTAQRTLDDESRVTNGREGRMSGE